MTDFSNVQKSLGKRAGTHPRIPHASASGCDPWPRLCSGSGPRAVRQTPPPSQILSPWWRDDSVTVCKGKPWGDVEENRTQSTGLFTANGAFIYSAINDHKSPCSPLLPCRLFFPASSCSPSACCSRASHTPHGVSLNHPASVDASPHH